MEKFHLDNCTIKVKSLSNRKIDFYDNVEEAKKWVNHYYKEKQRKKLLADLKKTLIQYTEGFYKIINPLLRKTEEG